MVGSNRAERDGRDDLIGREHDVESIVDLVRTDGVRLVTITGRAGVGKTAVATEVVRRLMILDPVASDVVSLSGRSGDLELDRLDVALAPSGPSELLGPGAPAGRTRLVVVDGAEVHLEAVAQSVRDALVRDPDLAVLVTSTGPLAIAGEHRVTLGPLPLPGTGLDIDAEVAASPAVQLFCDRVRSALPSFELDRHNRDAVVTICERLDGLPLALELAAARCATLPLPAVVELMSDSALDVAAGGSASGQDRHRSVRSAILWSYDLLDDRAQVLLRRLAIFVGRFSWSSMVAVAGWDRHTAELLDDLGALVSCGLVLRLADDQQGPEYALPTTVREVVGELLERSGELEVVREHHIEHHRCAARLAAQRAFGPESGALRRSLAPRQDDLVAAVQALADRGDVAAALQMAVDLQPMWSEGSATAGARLLVELSERPHGGSSSADPAASELLDAWAAASLAELIFWGAPVERDVVSLLADVSTVAERWDDVDLQMLARRMLVQHHVVTDTHGAALRCALDAVEAAEAHGEDWWTASISSWACVAANQAGETHLALDLGVRSQRLALSVGDDAMTVRTAFVLRGVEGAAADPHALVPPLAEIIDAARRVGDDQIESWALIAMAVEQCLAGDAAGAATALRDGMRLAQDLGRWSAELLCVAALTVVLAVRGHAEGAARLHGGLLARLPDIQRMLAPSHYAAYDAAVAAARATLGDARFEELVAAGRLMPWRQTLETADSLIDHLLDDDPSAGSGRPTSAGSVGSPLTDRELEVLELIADGCSNKQIAIRLGLRPKTVMHHSSHIYRKLGVASRAEATSAGFRLGLLAGGGSAGS